MLAAAAAELHSHILQHVTTDIAMKVTANQHAATHLLHMAVCVWHMCAQHYKTLCSVHAHAHS